MNQTETSGFHLGTIAGTSIRVEISFLILVGFFVVMSLESRTPVQFALLWIPVIFISVLVHELGHAAVIGLLGFGRSEIYLAGFGGFTRNRRRARPWQDMLISLAGPVTSLLLSASALAVHVYFPVVSRDPMGAALIPLLIQANVFWAIFNLVPLHPLDGGQALRNFLRIVIEEKRAVLISVWISMILGAILILWGIRSHQYFLAIIAGLLTMQNFQEWQAYRRPPPSNPS